MKLLRSLLLLNLAFGLAPGGFDVAPHAHAESTAPAKQLYTCGMHPQIIKDAPGDCPICGMKLTPIRANSSGATKGPRKIEYYKSTMIPGEVSPNPGKDSMGMDLVPVYSDAGSTANAIHIDTGTIQRMNLKTDLVTRGSVSRTIRNVGVVAYNEQGLRDITTKYDGWLEKLYVNATWSMVQAGDPLFEIYSPDLYNAQLNYLIALRAEGGSGGSLTHAALARLELYDVSAEFIAEITKTGEARRTYLYRSPAAGVVIEKMAVAGQMMKPGERIYRIADLTTVWVLAQIYERDLPFVHAGQPATVRATYGRDRELAAEIELLLPQVEEQTRTATARLALPNPDGYLRPGMFVDVRVAAQIADSAVLVPEIAVLRSGEHNTVFLVKADGSFEPREVRLGALNHDRRYEVLAGLAEGDRIVTSGQFMLDSESQLREAIQKMLRASQPAAAVAPPTPASAKPAPAADKTTTLYTCPMDSHAHIVAAQPGKCPECNMTLVPTRSVAHGKIAEAAWTARQAAAAAPASASRGATPEPKTAPAGAPEIADLLALLKRHPSAPPASAEACGSCGMTQAAMAAGEPCEAGK